jgi:Methyltransferase domain
MNTELSRKVSKRAANAIFRLLGGSSLFAPPGHYYSPVVDPTDANRFISNSPRISDDEILPHIDTDELSINFKRLSRHFPKIKSFLGVTDALRYRESTNYFNYGDAYILASFIAEFRPKNFIEIGSGYSSACAIDTSDVMDTGTSFTFIDPNPERLNGLLLSRDKDSCRVYPTPVQDVDLRIFDILGESDILFLDTTHVLKTGSDLNFELFHILPRLKPGVIVHFHDIFCDWEYPDKWIYKDNRSWNEIYALRSFLMYNDDFEILYFNDFVWKRLPQIWKDTELSQLSDPGSGIYIQKKPTNGKRAARG